MNPKTHLRRQRRRVLEALPPLDELVRGSLVERRVRCGKPTCRCARDEGHLVYTLTTSFARGHTQQITVPARFVPHVQQWIDNYHRWWNAIEQVSALNRELLRQRWLDDPDPPPRRR